MMINLNKSLVKNILVSTALRFCVVVAIATGFGFWHVLHVTENQTMSTLEKYVFERSQRERQIFTIAHQNHSILKAELEKALQGKTDVSLTANFDHQVKLFPDQTWRSKIEKYDGTQEACVFIGTQTLVNDAKKQQIATFTALINRFGPAWHHQFQDLYFTTPDNVMVLYWPEVPSWCHDAKKELYMPDEEYLWVADLKHNPERKTKWTGLFFDKVAKVWMTSVETPVDIQGVHVATIGHDVTLNQLVDRTLDDHLLGAYNFIFRTDGRLIVHPDFIKEIKNKDGYFDIQESGTPLLKAIFLAIKASSKKSGVLRLQNEKLYVGFAHIDEPDWYFITILPYKAGRLAANSTVWILILIGLSSLLADILFLSRVLNRQIAQPLKRMIKETDDLAQGNYDAHVDTFRQDEIGQLANAFNEMANKLKDAHSDLEGKIKKRTTEVNEALANLQNAHNQLKQMQNQLVQSQKMEAVGQLAGGIAHDFNNLLTVIIGYAEILIKSVPLNSADFQKIEQIYKAGKRASDLTSQLLTFSRKQVIQPEIVDLNRTIRDMEPMIRRTLAESIELEIVLAEHLNMVKVDPGQMHQVLLNLIINARDAMSKGGKIIIETLNLAADKTFVEKCEGMIPGDYVVLSVRDSGSGMTSEIKARIFEPFFTTKEQGKGTGLGLATCYGIVKQAGGYIYVDSEVDKGTDFKIYLHATEGVSDVLMTSGPGDRALNRGNETLLLVEDETAVREFATEILRKNGYEVIEAENGADALHLLSQSPSKKIHAVITDVIMPVMGGKELADKIRLLYPDIKIIFISGYSEEHLSHQGMLHEGVTLLHKPFSSGDLFAIIRKVLNS